MGCMQNYRIILEKCDLQGVERYWKLSRQSRLNVLGGPGPARLMGPLLSLWPTWKP